MAKKNEPYVWLNEGEDDATSDDGGIRLVRSLRGSDDPAVFLAGPYAVAHAKRAEQQPGN